MGELEKVKKAKKGIFRDFWHCIPSISYRLISYKKRVY